MHIIIYCSQHCPACENLSADVARLCRTLDATVETREVLEHIEQAARTGIVRPPAVVINGRLFGQGAGVLTKLRREYTA